MMDESPPEQSIREGPSSQTEVACRKKRRRNTSFEPLANVEDIHRLGRIAKSVPRKAPPAFKAARKEFRSAVAERDLAQTTLDSARHEAEEAQRKLSAAERQSEHAEDRFLRARSAVEELDLQNPACKWNEHFTKLEAFHARHGHTRLKSVPEEFNANQEELVKLDKWLGTQRRLYRKLQNGESTTFQPHRMVALKRLGVFVGKWEEAYKRLLTFKEEHGHCNVPTRSYHDKKLGLWVGFQRSDYKKLKDGKHSTLTPERIKLLKDIGFEFNTYEARGIVRNRKYGVDTEEQEESIGSDS
eukprot:CAMPEP_0172312868 /NCGR_PEP_ID=MMETSP1058-20130122/18700_1 /TAXON_ID=83371 /ORGANISM="Detonula confervacea, Strain CCMP 353" /LENGTH=299 /DNA_ID=CAMNT_0013026423 /DNA_START=187 /DNA_END=1086 /DNA_ORIENTATION=-